MCCDIKLVISNKNEKFKIKLLSKIEIYTYFRWTNKEMLLHYFKRNKNGGS